MSLRSKRCDECPQNGTGAIHFTPGFGELTTSCFLNSIFLLIAWVYFFGIFFYGFYHGNHHLSPTFGRIFLDLFPSILGKQIKQIVMYGIGTSIYFEPSLPRISITFGVRLLASLLSLWLYGYHPICSHVKLRLHWLRCAPLLNVVVFKEDFANFPRLGGSSQLVSS